MNNNIFQVDFAKLVQWCIPPQLRQAKTVAWLLALTKPVVTLYQVFRRYRKQKLYELYITPQVCYLEKLLNDKYDKYQRRIYIDDPKDKPQTFFYLRDELKPVVFYRRSENKPVVIYTRGESGDIKDDFIIFLPNSLAINESELLQLVKGYRLAGMKPKLQRF